MTSLHERERQEHEEYLASCAIDWMDGLPKQIWHIIYQGNLTHDLDLNKAETGDAIEAIDQILDDLFHKARRNKVKVCGDPIESPAMYGTQAPIPLPNPVLKGFSPFREALAVTKEDVKP